MIIIKVDCGSVCLHLAEPERSSGEGDVLTRSKQSRYSITRSASTTSDGGTGPPMTRRLQPGSRLMLHFNQLPGAYKGPVE
jgi:hypothetical protein